MRQEYKLIYIGILKFGFKSADKVSIVGLLDYIERNDLKLDEEPIAHVNKSYIPKTDDWFWEIEMWSRSGPESRCLVVYFDELGCHYHRYFGFGPDVFQNDQPGDIVQYEGFLDQYKWLVSP